MCRSRKGFVSNSSSSSFILAVRNYHSVGEIDGGVFARLAKELTRFLRECTLTSFDQIVHDKLVDEVGADYAVYDNPWSAEEIKDIRERIIARVARLLGPGEKVDGWRFHYGWASNDSGEIVSQLLYEEQIEIMDANVRLG